MESAYLPVNFSVLFVHRLTFLLTVIYIKCAITTTIQCKDNEAKVPKTKVLTRDV